MESPGRHFSSNSARRMAWRDGEGEHRALRSLYSLKFTREGRRCRSRTCSQELAACEHSALSFSTTWRDGVTTVPPSPRSSSVGPSSFLMKSCCLAAFVSGLLRIPFTLVPVFLVDRLGRRPLMISSTFIAFLSLCFMIVGIDLGASWKVCSFNMARNSKLLVVEIKAKSHSDFSRSLTLSEKVRCITNSKRHMTRKET